MERFIYGAVILSAYDGDTIRADIDVGFTTTKNNESLRLWGINTPEIRGGTLESKARGREARDYVIEKTLGAEDILIKTHKDKKGKYGRYLAEVFYKEDGEYINLNKELVDKGMAVEYLKGKKDFKIL